MIKSCLRSKIADIKDVPNDQGCKMDQGQENRKTGVRKLGELHRRSIDSDSKSPCISKSEMAGTIEWKK